VQTTQHCFHSITTLHPAEDASDMNGNLSECGGIAGDGDGAAVDEAQEWGWEVWIQTVGAATTEAV
jgi:hypothetical protein